MSYNNVTTAPGIQRAAVICRGKTAQQILSWTTLTNWAEVQDLSANFDPVTGILIAPRAGIYDWTLGDAIGNPIGQYIGLSIIRNGVQLYNHLITVQSGSAQYLSMSGSVEMAVGETLSPRMYATTAVADVASVSNSWFTIIERNTIF